ncbi:MAG: metallopeptidase family protein [Myxococcales bacterium]|nr:metallopeptidase family protein [Myxococcales bacterium]
MDRSERVDADGRIAPLLERAAEEFEQGHFDQVLSLAQQALEEHPGNAEALHYRAASQLELGDAEAAEASYRKASKLSPEDPEILLGLADLLICHPGEDRSMVEEGIALCARGRKRLGKEDGELCVELLLLEGIGLNQLGQCELALARLDEALRIDPGSVDAALERGIALFELCRFDAAERELKKVVSVAADEPWAHHYLGLLAERRGELREAKRRFSRGRRLAPEEFPPPVELSDAEFDAAVEAAVARLPAHVMKHLENVNISVEALPSEEDLLASRPPLSPCILGVFRGTPVGERSVSSAFDHFPAAIVLYQRNLERFAGTKEELIEQIGITVMHEVGHLIGLDEEDLWERGLE